METRILNLRPALAALAVLASFNLQLSTGFAQGTSAFTYHGRLTDNGSALNGLYDMSFSLFDANSAGTMVGYFTNAPISVSNGLFVVQLNFGSNAFSGAARWLEIGVRTNGSVAAYTTLSPRQQITPTPYAVFAGTAANAGAATTAASASSVAANAVNNAALQNSSVDSSKIADGSIGSGDLSSTVLSNTFWRLGGNASTTPGAQFVGTTDNQSLEFRVNSTRALRLEPAAIPNVIGGSTSNRVTAGVVGAFIGGGGTNSATQNNRVTDDYGTVGGGLKNKVGDDSGTTGDRSFATVGGGFDNTANGANATVAGGFSNNSLGGNSAVGGGTFNNAQADNSTIAGGAYNQVTIAGQGANIAGGRQNLASGSYAVIPGGFSNLVSGAYGFAAGRRAKAINDGAFVWADSTDADFSSTANNQFLIRASGGVGIGTTTPDYKLDVEGALSVHYEPVKDLALRLQDHRTDTTFSDFLCKQSFYDYDNSAEAAYIGLRHNLYHGPFFRALVFGVSDTTGVPASEKMRITRTGNVGIGTTTPSARLHVVQTTGIADAIYGVSARGSGVQGQGDVGVSGVSQGGVGVQGINSTSGYYCKLATPSFGADMYGPLKANGNAFFTTNVYCDGYYWCKFDGVYHRLDIQAGAAYWGAPSDRNFKQNVATVPNALDTLRKLRGVTWSWNETGLQYLTRDIKKKWKSASGTPEDDLKLWQEKRVAERERLSKQQIGFIAQEVEQVFPNWVTTDEQGFKKINMEHLNAVMVNAIKEQQEQITAQQKEIANLRRKASRLTGMEDRLASLEKMIKHLSVAQNGGAK